MIEQSPDLKNFLSLAQDLILGEAAESKNVAASELAYAVLDEIQFLDEPALRGLCEFIGIVKIAPDKARELLESN